MNSEKEKYISVVIPNYNRAETIGKCLEAAFSSDYTHFEVIVVDDNSSDNSREVIKQFPCRLIALDRRGGASKARNRGALKSKGDIIFFTDSDCLLKRDTLSHINSAMSRTEPDVIVGGTYAKEPYDDGFFNRFQAMFVHYSETKTLIGPDYVAAHAMAIDAETFRTSGGFPEVFLPIIEDVEFSHRLRRAGCSFVVNPDIQVRHIFGFHLVSSLRNAFRKSYYWNIYSLGNRDVLTDSGTASYELKSDVASLFLCLILVMAWSAAGSGMLLYAAVFFFSLNIIVNLRLLKFFFGATEPGFGIMASLYYLMVYPLPIGFATLKAVVMHLLGKERIKT